MSKRIFTEEQMNSLLNNQNVLRCSSKSITYSHTFKIDAVRQYIEKGVGAKQIFKEAGFDLEVIGRGLPKECLGRWCRNYKRRGENSLLVEKRGKGNGIDKGRPRLRGLTDAEKIKRLELTVLYLKAENDFLAKLQAKRAE